ncbi:hypothetical protein GCM10025867_50290 (plasmid) [Frondihabitans sucicola]|uniref:Uncharacterized protein n=1 Tax=Frondihabitans sucicola TaxID=1268041 RepID=A0ABN6Y9V0_9MICO|nr:hypothetical protein [Frondihabitans sucicola]BDZ52788.1 hypothetical protein GCM10025867_50290 [Frondihabitans sucicola]
MSKSEPTIEAVMALILRLIERGPQYQSQVNDVLRSELPGTPCDLFGDAVATLLHDGRLRIHEHRYERPVPAEV